MSALYNVLYSAVTGDVAPANVQALQDQETQNLIAAGADPTTAAAQAQSDVDTTLATYSGSGGLGLTWTGAAPGGASFLTAAQAWIGTYWWVIALAIVLVLGFLFFAYGKGRGA